MLLTSPARTGSEPLVNTIGIVAVSALAAIGTLLPPVATMTASRRADGDAGIARGRLDVPMPEQVLDDANVDALFKQVGRKTVSQRVDCDRLAQSGGLGRASAGQLKRRLGHRPGRMAPGTEPVPLRGPAPIVAE